MLIALENCFSSLVGMLLGPRALPRLSVLIKYIFNFFGRYRCQNESSRMEIVCTFCIQKLYKMYTTDVYKIYTRYVQNTSQILTNFCIHFVHKIKRTMAVKISMPNVYKRLSKCGIHFVYTLYTFCIHEF